MASKLFQRLLPAARQVAGVRAATFHPVAARFMSGKAPLPEPKWKQAADLDDIIPGNIDQATGLERAEMLAEMEGKQIFEDGMVGPFGTAENPVMVESIYDERIVGCPGGCADGDTSINNEMRWFVVTSKAPYKCPTCSQVFAIKKITGHEYGY
eukprot:CAMPEP_0206234842 /NCGR_PEP_ID=MMETSP0047_2-20121206/12812_1 /ASSEMBLY_ACC=CAM_ASM_000192 /TAXON_ID=195065 /ORGANISM="Chroomonas mesostigmatica_cf, Strain CCMP1168" /LENGTH=153 /DNA_ID=CAMNT_0053658967 /DNA_START=45 /DNA_END=506 /DNA_ORIENTATION=-